MKKQFSRLCFHVKKKLFKLRVDLFPGSCMGKLEGYLSKEETNQIWENIRKSNQETGQAITDLEFTDEDIDSLEDENLDFLGEEIFDSGPALSFRNTMLFEGKSTSKKCNFLTAPFYRSNIRRAYFWATAHGIDVFIVDYTCPIGMLAMETLLDLRDSGEKFHIYAVRGKYICARRSYRLIKETNLELIFMTGKCDYNYSHLFVQEMKEKILSKVGVIYTEKGIYVKDELLEGEKT